jgi:hypothetical protein
MVLDPFTALSLAGNAIQFVEFASKIVSKGNEIRKDGAASETLVLEYTTTRLQELTIGLRNHNREVLGVGCLSKDDQILEDVSRDCVDVGSVLLDKLQKVKVLDSDKHRRWKSWRQALKLVWRKEDLDMFAKKLAAFKSQLEFGILIALK